jgi:hypothetical protein
LNRGKFRTAAVVALVFARRVVGSMLYGRTSLAEEFVTYALVPSGLTAMPRGDLYRQVK